MQVDHFLLEKQSNKVRLGGWESKVLSFLVKTYFNVNSMVNLSVPSILVFQEEYTAYLIMYCLGTVRLPDICLIVLHCAFSNVSSNCLPEQRQSRTGCICLAFLRCAFSNVSSKRSPQQRQNYIGCICVAFLHCVF